MNRRQFTRNFFVGAGALTLQPLSRLFAQPKAATPHSSTDSVASGTIYGVKNGRKIVLPGVRVSNGREIALTDRLGRYALPIAAGEMIFLCKPRGFALPLNANNIAQAHYFHQPQGSPASKFPGAAPTGKLPASLDFTLTEQKEDDNFRVLLFGDPQSRNQEEIGFLTRDILADVAGQSAAFGVSLGDLAFDDLSIYPNQNRAIAGLKMPWFNVRGNHDLNFDAPGRVASGETYQATFGPLYHSFDYGAAHFVVLDNVAYEGKTGEILDGKPDNRTLDGKRRGAYGAELGQRQLQWLENDLKTVPRDQLVVFLMHIPLAGSGRNRDGDMKDLGAFWQLIQNRPHTLSISAHTHVQQHLFLGREAGFEGQTPHHHFNSVTTCGSWWRGAREPNGIPHATMSDGVPNGTSFLNIKGNTYSIDFKAAGSDANHQMNIYAPPEIAREATAKTEVLANIFAGSSRSKVEMRVAGRAWTPMQLSPRPDPAYVAARQTQEAAPRQGERPLPEPSVSTHIWAAALPADLPSGAHTVEVRSLDMWGASQSDRVSLRVI